MWKGFWSHMLDLKESVGFCIFFVHLSLLCFHSLPTTSKISAILLQATFWSNGSVARRSGDASVCWITLASGLGVWHLQLHRSVTLALGICSVSHVFIIFVTLSSLGVFWYYDGSPWIITDEKPYFIVQLITMYNVV